MSERIMIVGAGHNQERIIRQAVDLGYYVAVIDGNSSAPGLQYAHKAFVADIMNPTTIVKAAMEHKIDGIVPAAELSVEAVSIACQQLGLPGASVNAARCMRNKRIMRDTLVSAGISCPVYSYTNELGVACEVADRLGYPLVTKPVDGNASRGVRHVNSDIELHEAFEIAKAAARNGIVLLESFMDGNEFSLDGIMYHGDYYLGGIAGKRRSPLPYRYDTALFMPAPLEQTETERLIQATASALCAVGFDLGATHVEVIMTPEGPHIVEMAGRPGGARIATDLIPLAYGMDYTEDLLRVALDQPPKRKHSIIAGSAIEWISAPSGKLRRICGLESAASVPGIVDVVVRAYPGMMLHAPVDCVSRDMLGYVLASGQTASDALEACDQACTHIQTLFDY